MGNKSYIPVGGLQREIGVSGAQERLLDKEKQELGLGAGEVTFKQAGAGAVERTVQDKLREVVVSVEDFGAVGDGTTLCDAAFLAAKAEGKVAQLKAGSTYLLSVGLAMVTGSGFVCIGGVSTIRLKTGAGGFNIRNTGGTRTSTDRCVISCVSVDDITIENIDFETDGVAEAVIYPIRTSGGGGTRGFRFRNIEFRNFAALSGGLLSLNSVGAGSYLVENVTSRNCTTAQGNTYWTGGVQITTAEIDNDMVGGVPSVPSVMNNIRVYDQLLTGQALTDYGQQTDCVNIAGIAAADRKGPTINGIYADGVGEVLDMFGAHAIVKGIRARNVHHDVVKLIHGCEHADIEVESVESCGRSVVFISGSSSTAEHTHYNHVRVGSVKGVGTVGPLTGATCAAVVFADDGGTGKPRNNVIEIGRVLGDGTNMDYVVSDGGADNSNNNIVIVKQASGWATAFCSAPPGNVRISCVDSTDVELTLGSAQAITLATNTLVDFSVAARDVNAEAVTASDKVRCKFPGLKAVHAQVRVDGLNDGDVVILRILKNGVSVAEGRSQSASGTATPTCTVSRLVYIGEDVAGAAGADLSVQIRVEGTGAPTLNTNATLSFFQVVMV